MTELSLTQSLPATIRVPIPDADKEGVVKIFEFKLRFRLYDQNDEMKAKLEQDQVDKGPSGFLEQVIESATGPEGVTFGKLPDGSDVTALYFVCHHLICQGEATNRFWEIVNKGVIEKNLKRSRSR